MILEIRLCLSKFSHSIHHLFGKLCTPDILLCTAMSTVDECVKVFQQGTEMFAIAAVTNLSASTQ